MFGLSTIFISWTLKFDELKKIADGLKICENCFLDLLYLDAIDLGFLDKILEYIRTESRII